MTIKFYSFQDDRTITAPYGAFSKKEMLALMEAKTAKGRPLGRNAIRYWLYVLCHSSGRKSQPYRLNKKNLQTLVCRSQVRTRRYPTLYTAGS